MAIYEYSSEDPEADKNLINIEPAFSFRCVQPTEIYTYLSRFVVGQEAAKRKLSILGYLHAMRQQTIYCGFRRQSLPKLNLFISGPTGTGKTELITRFAECMEIPYHRIDCASLSQTGWAGTDISEYLYEFSMKSKKHPHGIIHLDEFDKLGNSVTSSSGHAPAISIQSNLLDLLDGKYSHVGHGNTIINQSDLECINNSLVIMSGAFEAASKEQKKAKTKGMGFGALLGHKEEINWRKLMEENHILPEIIGRLTAVVATHELEKEQLRAIIETKEDSVYQKYQKLLYQFELDGEELDSICDKLEKSEYGARDLDYEFFDHVSEKLIKKWGL